MPYSHFASSLRKVIELLDNQDFPKKKLEGLKWELFSLILTGEDFFKKNASSDLFTLFKNRKLIPGFSEEIKIILNSLQKTKLSEAIWSYYRYNFPIRKIFKKYPINPRDWQEVATFSSEIDFANQDFDTLISQTWHEQFEENEIGCEIIFDEKAMDDILVASIEGYLSPRKRMKKSYEVFGVCLGTITEVQDNDLFKREIFHVTKCPPQISADGNNSSCMPKDKSYSSLEKVQKYLFPQFKIIGEYHSHPYEDLAEITSCQGWKNSQQDERRWAACKAHGGYGDLQFALIVAISKIKRNKKEGIVKPGPNHLCFNLEDLKVHFYAVRILSTGAISEKNIKLKMSKMLG